MKALNQWARYYGYNDFDTFIRAGGSLREAVRDIQNRIDVLQEALNAVCRMGYVAARHAQLEKAAEPLISPDAVTDDEPPETDNAHVQGAELG